MNLWQEYIRPNTSTPALEALRVAPGPAAPIAGGTDLNLVLQQGRYAAVRSLVDLASVEEMNRLELRGEELRPGTAMPGSTIVCNPLVAPYARDSLPGPAGGPFPPHEPYPSAGQ